MKLPFLLHDQIELTIDRLSAGGRGVGRFEGAVVFAADTAPGDRVLARITHLHKNFADAELIKVVQNSPERIIPSCPVAGICGGCTWQHVSYEEQLKQKQSLVHEALRKFSGFKDFMVLPTLPSPKIFRYRNRIQVHASRGRLGFFKRASHDIVDIHDCPITEVELTQKFSEIREKTLSESQMQRVEIMHTTVGGIDLIWNASDESSAQGFSQVNTAQNQNLIQMVLREAQTHAAKPKKIFDLYAGGGNFTFPLAQAYPELSLQAVEYSEKSVALARQHISIEELSSSVFFHNAKVESFLKTARTTDFEDALVLLDPPRTGCDPEVMRTLAKTNPLVILYVSCNPATLARDLQPLAKAGFRLHHVQPIDMFPQTDHVETLVTLLPSSKSV